MFQSSGLGSASLEFHSDIVPHSEAVGWVGSKNIPRAAGLLRDFRDGVNPSLSSRLLAMHISGRQQTSSEARPIYSRMEVSKRSEFEAEEPPASTTSVRSETTKRRNVRFQHFCLPDLCWVHSAFSSTPSIALLRPCHGNSTFAWRIEEIAATLELLHSLSSSTLFPPQYRC